MFTLMKMADIQKIHNGVFWLTIFMFMAGKSTKPFINSYAKLKFAMEFMEHVRVCQNSAH